MYSGDNSPTPQRRQMRASTNSGKKKGESLRQQRGSMVPTVKDDNLQLGQAIQAHIWMLGGLSRSKQSFLQSPTDNQLERLPDLPDSKVAPNDWALIAAKKVDCTWDQDGTMGQDFSGYCLQRATQYGLLCFGLSIVKGNAKAAKWNRSAVTFCVDTFAEAVRASNYNCYLQLGYKFNHERVEELVERNFVYCIAEMTKDFQRTQAIKRKKQETAGNTLDVSSESDGTEAGKAAARTAREGAKKMIINVHVVLLRRWDICRIVAQLKPVTTLLPNECLCSSDELSSDKNNKTCIRQTPRLTEPECYSTGQICQPMQMVNSQPTTKTSRKETGKKNEVGSMSSARRINNCALLLQPHLASNTDTQTKEAAQHETTNLHT
ncbi:hypothetical protein PSTT_12616 [Puccinia striiformis]|uniref:Uncharacterized protein n=1 Tax=Puccinia striiformis TaxID=27350 RepID=A0A2S4UVA3_9BASI|nr:hypothetical protein PSTT_12616 [Puccinia striiformis]